MLIIAINVLLALIAWIRVAQRQRPITSLRPIQGIAHALLLLQVLLGIGLLARGQQINLIHPLMGIVTLLSLFVSLIPSLRLNRALLAAVVPTVVAILALITYALGELARRGRL